MSGQPILVCTDDQRLLAELPDQVRLDGYRRHTAQAPRQFRWALREHRPAAVVLGELPTLAATLALLRELRAGQTGGQDGADPEVPVLVLSRAGGELCELRAFEAGADDYQPASTQSGAARAAARAGGTLPDHPPRSARRGGAAADRRRRARGELRRPAAGALPARVRPAAAARPRATPRLHEG
jgi:CheY-like chemotaxis protein